MNVAQIKGILFLASGRCVVFNCAKFYHPKCLGMDPEAVKQNFMWCGLQKQHQAQPCFRTLLKCSLVLRP